MVADQDIWQSAQQMVDRYGDDALVEINKRIHELELNDQEEARDVWLRIREAVKTLEEGKRH